MFGLVPRPIWERGCPPDAHNRIRQHANVFLVRDAEGQLGLIDTGCGLPETFPAKALEASGLDPTCDLPRSLARIGVSPESIDWVFLTHLHWDHAGGLTDADHAPLFPNARVRVHEQEWRCATEDNPLLYKSYPQDVLAKVTLYHDRNQLELLDGAEALIAPGVFARHSGGHTAGHCTVWFPEAQIAGRDETSALLAADVCPTQHHLRMVYQTAYDTFPLQTRAWKQAHLPALASNHGLLLLTHDPDAAGVAPVADPKREFVAKAPWVPPHFQA